MLMPRYRCRDSQMAETNKIKVREELYFFLIFNLNLFQLYIFGLHRNHKKYLNSMQIFKKIIDKGSFG